VFPDTIKLDKAIRGAYPWAFAERGEYCPCDPFMPAVRFEAGKPVFWDSCSNLYNMLFTSRDSSEKVFVFTKDHKSCYDHLNSASFYKEMAERLTGLHREGFIAVHDRWVKNPAPGLWPLVDEYYRQKEIEGKVSI
jgi:hypothetical protein